MSLDNEQADWIPYQIVVFVMVYRLIRRAVYLLVKAESFTLSVTKHDSVTLAVTRTPCIHIDAFLRSAL